MKQTKYKSVESVLKNNGKEIIVNMMDEYMLSDSSLINYCKRNYSYLTLNQFRDKIWIDKSSKNEFATILSVEFGRIFELYLPYELEKFGCDAIPKFTSEGDMSEGMYNSNFKKGILESIIDKKGNMIRKEKSTLEDDIHWEIKTGRSAKIQGSTHSPKEKKPMNLIQVLWSCYMDKPLDEILEDKKFISEINISVFRNTMLDSEGKHTNQNSRTTLGFKSNRYDECVNACVYGSVQKNSVWVKFVQESV